MRRSGIREIMLLAGQMSDVIHLEVGEPDFDTPMPVVRAGQAALEEGYTKYTPNAGTPALREALAKKLSGQGRPVHPDQIVITPGAVCALSTAVLATVDPGDEVLVPDPGWPNYWSMAQLAGGHPVTYPLLRASGYLPDLAGLRARVTPRTKLLLINTPSNPAGAVIPLDLMQALIDFAVEHDLYLLSDEVYESFVFEGRHHSAATLDPDGRVITVSGFSKTYAMTGWRLGYARAPEPIAQLITRLQEPLVSCASAVAQKAAERALRIPDEDIARMRSAYRDRRDLAASILEPAGLLAAMPHGAFYALVDLHAVGHDSYALARDVLTRKRVATAPGETFGDSGAGLVRISLASAASDVAEGCRRLVDYARQR